MAPERQREAQTAQVSEDIKREVQLFERLEPLDCHPPIFSGMEGRKMGACIKACSLHLSQQCMTVCSVMQCSRSVHAVFASVTASFEIDP